jgi:hypothetical protein
LKTCSGLAENQNLPFLDGHELKDAGKLFLENTETFAKRQFLSKFKEGDNFNQRNTLGILRIKI